MRLGGESPALPQPGTWASLVTPTGQAGTQHLVHSTAQCSGILHLTCSQKGRAIHSIMEEKHSGRAELITRREAGGGDEFPAWQLWEITGGSPAYLDTTRRAVGQKC